MEQQSKRTGIAWLLLSIFVSIMMLSGLHCQEEVDSASAGCAECAHHIHHSGHFSTVTDHMDDCLLCQFISFVYTAAAVTVLVPLVALARNRRFLQNSSILQGEPVVLNSRGPPSF